eukprot:TRINITY_DN98233_c0_g1_i1.p1 TRINITY_DN98233_c0_g1~~TRINITY_DN98233_c0_g1_i1.p1  ORF type:complete len:317 (+),score=44.61 TRINITY_DN98233_c0_g1_i1:47-997(+)
MQHALFCNSMALSALLWLLAGQSSAWKLQNDTFTSLDPNQRHAAQLNERSEGSDLEARSVFDEVRRFDDLLCLQDTGGTCRLEGCWAERGPTACVQGRCLCKPGLCASSQGTCIKEKSRLVPGSYRITSEKYPDYFLYMEHGTFLFSEAGYVRVKKASLGPEGLWRLVVMPDGMVLLSTEAQPNRILSVGRESRSCGKNCYRTVYFGQHTGAAADAFRLEKTVHGKLMLMDVNEQVHLYISSLSSDLWGCSGLFCHGSAAYWTFDPPLPEGDEGVVLNAKMHGRIGAYSFFEVAISCMLVLGLIWCIGRCRKNWSY